jgi:tRNA A37 threonylcarbamoyladenosine biosynthesis protein TsaE
MTKSINFEFLRNKWPDLAESAGLAEKYAYSDPQSALLKLRYCAEKIVGCLYRELRIPCDDNPSFFEQLDSSDFKKVVDEKILKKLHAIRLKANRAVHKDGVTKGDALWLIKETYLIACWLYTGYEEGDIESCGKFKPIEKASFQLEDLKNTSEVLQNELDDKNSHLHETKRQLDEALSKEHELQKEFNALKLEIDQVKVEAFKESSKRAAKYINLDDGEIEKHITIDDIFSDYDLTSQQADLISELDSFLSNKNDCVFLLKGYAGTGKTFITKGLTEYLKTIRRNYKLAAPTGKAAKVIQQKTKSKANTIHRSIYSFKEIKEHQVEETDSNQFYYELNVNRDSLDTVYIIDEVSMISDKYQEEESLRFGSGFLLRDLLKYINTSQNKKIIFIGDTAQLPPVGMNFSPVLDEKYLRNEYGLNLKTFELTEVVRQVENSGILKNSLVLRKSIKDDEFSKIEFDTNYPDIEHIDHENLMQNYIESCGNQINGDSIVIAYSNASVTEYNKRIREHFFPGQLIICPGDKVMATNNKDLNGFVISNGDFGLVRQVAEEPEIRKVQLKKKSRKTKKIEYTQIELKFRQVEVGFRDPDNISHFFQCQIIEDLLYSNLPALTADENNAIYIDFCIRYQHLKRGTKEFKDTLRSDPYLNALRLKFGYAITCHKAQGSEWKNVFINCKTHQKELSAGYFRWLYTAITRTSDKLYTLEEPHIPPGSTITPPKGVRPY